MKILIIQKSIGKDASGIVFTKFVKALSNLKSIKKIDLVLHDVSSNDQFVNKKINTIQLTSDENFNNILYKLCLIIFKRDIRYKEWFKNVINFFQKNKNEYTDYDLIVSLVSGSTGINTKIGCELASFYKTQHHIHMVDPIPPPKGWETYEIFRKSLIYPVRKYIKESSYFSSSNERMLKYQLSQVGSDFDSNKHFVIHNPTPDRFKIIDRIPNSKLILAFLGTIRTGARNPDLLFKALYSLHRQNLDFEFRIYGNNKNIKLDEYDIDFQNKIRFEPFVSNIEEIIPEIDILIDIDANIPNDVFISSKLFIYLAYNRPIICLTGTNSPTSDLLRTHNNSIYLNHFDKKKLIKTIKLLGKNLSYKCYDERLEILKTINYNLEIESVFEKIKRFQELKN